MESNKLRGDATWWQFIRRSKNPELPNLGPDLKPREVNWPPEKIAAHEKDYVELVNGQIEELLTNYGRIDLIWFDGSPAVGDEAKKNIISIDRIRQNPNGFPSLGPPS